ncbi:transmembrane amino acid transporter protein-domain-containing protein [Zychaea mexicana]|uniref:transmembrane amino acid transporter protein-domain-containing protein n=1 Tax=Zychaea mexicana TaxID=64656 RepID=UPI0022FE4DBB|nr:transmembrane amino acid transporter protein-domain-containing protein [Zychaea mexicana]KAI9490589.1 transmembrane amino acid transporter protein-domain-containing protein [Zychaea mexicana]
MSSPLPVNAKAFSDRHNQEQYQNDSERNLAGSFDRASSIARLSSSPVPPNVFYGSSPAASIKTYGSTNGNGGGAGGGADLSRVGSSHSLFRPLSNTTTHTDLPEGQVAKMVKRHLVETSPVPSRHEDEYPSDDNSSGITSVHQLPGGSITHGIYKWTENVEHSRYQRKRTRSVVLPRNEPSDPALANLKDPGGFRRHFIRAQRQGQEPSPWATKSFVEFLALYGHFGGEDLSDDEDDDDDEEEEGFLEGADEESPLIPQRRGDEPQGTATPAKAVFLLLKSFVGTGVMFLPKAFYNGGLIFSTVLLSSIAVISLYAFLLLIETRNKVPMSFGDIGGVLFGKGMRLLVLFAITLSQIGFVCAYMVFVAQNLQALVESIFHCEVNVPLAYLILGQIIVFVPLAMIRKIQKLSAFALIADLFILIGLVYLYYYDFLVLATHGIGQVIWTVNPSSFPMFIGTAVFTYEGVGLVIPITESMKDPSKFPKVLSWTLFGITLLFLSIGFISYLAFGEEVQTVIMLNLPATGTVDTIQGLYALAICLSIPLQLFPAIRIMENGLFTRSGKNNPVVKWQKNAFRFAMVLACAGIAIAGSSDLDKFVSLIGSFCCVPLCFLFPPLFHLKGVASTFRQKFIDITIIVFGVVSMTYTTFITVSLWSTGDEAPPVSRCIPHGN